jgi:hypothetical protein
MLQLLTPVIDHRPVPQAVHEVEPLSLILPASQALQSSMLSWKAAKLPLSLRNLPLGHWVQLLEPLFGM